MAGINVSAYAHSPVHKAIILKDYANLKEILEGLPKLGNAYDIKTEAASIAEDGKAAKISAVVDRRDVLNGDTPLHLAVKLGDAVAAEMLMAAGANNRLKNNEGWSALREAIIKKQDKIAFTMIQYSYNEMDEKWYRRFPRYFATMRRMRDFYMEITFHFESSVIPFISRIAPSDTYKIWKRGANMRADMTLAGFDGLRIKRSDQSVIFIGDESDDERMQPGFMCLVSHEKKEVVVPYLSRPSKPDEREMKQYLAKKSTEAKVVRVAIDVSQSLLVPQITWRRKERKESVGPWKSKVYDMQNVVLTIKSKRVPGAQPAQSQAKLPPKEKQNEKLEDMLTDDERKQLEEAEMNYSEENNAKKGKKGKSSGGHKEKDHHHNHHKAKTTKMPSTNSASTSSNASVKEENGDTEYKRGMIPVLWLSQNFPLKIEEFLPLLDILAEKVKAVRRVRELLTTKLPKDTFPVKIAIPVVSPVKVLVTFTKFEELPKVDEFESAPSSPTSADLENQPEQPPSSWFQWIRTPSQSNSSSAAAESYSTSQDLFTIPSNYTWTDLHSKMKASDKNKPKDAKPSS
ncbi:unnamed protein product [Lathyrus oleraceus]|uniref:Ankyrin repeat domain-containing protein n=1 Tax=Pisum sativum TaxID=3888 RepID=A0A9D4W434_PEA|nr:uncharacterized protein LOC127090984 [Pisum sativum]KAI5394593.1 hypothetical protein KIW84_061290 [Pisum sativum]